MRARATKRQRQTGLQTDGQTDTIMLMIDASSSDTEPVTEDSSGVRTCSRQCFPVHLKKGATRARVGRSPRSIPEVLL